jgi:hypothetical protein
MKSFKINRNSWHYKFNKNFMNEYGLTDYSMQNNWEPRHSDFCSYWRATVFRAIWASVLLFFAGLIIFAAGIGTYNNPVAALSIVLGGILFIGTVILFFFGIEKLKARNKSKVNEPESLLMQKYRAHKSKICPMVEYD